MICGDILDNWEFTEVPRLLEWSAATVGSFVRPINSWVIVVPCLFGFNSPVGQYFEYFLVNDDIVCDTFFGHDYLAGELEVDTARAA